MEPVLLTHFTRPDAARADTLAAQIYRDLRAAIVSGRLAPGASLPSSRRAAETLGVSRNTLNSAYDLLRAEGLIDIGPCRAPIIAAVRSIERPEPTEPVGAPASRSVTSDWTRDVRAPAYASRTGFLSPGSPDASLFPGDAWGRALRRAARRSWPTFASFQNYVGYEPLRIVLAEQLARDRGMRVSPEQILITPSTQASISLIAQALARPGDGVLVEDPGYLGARAVFAGAGLSPIPMAVDEEGAAPPSSSLPDNVRLIHLTPSNQFPMGYRLSLPRRLAFIELARQTGAIIVEDDYDSEFLWRGREIAAMHALGTGDEVIYLGTTSKTLMLGMRLAWMAAPPDLAGPLAQAQRNLGMSVNIHVQAALADFITCGDYRAHLHRITRTYAERAQTLAATLTGRLAERMSVRTPDGGLQMPLLFRAGQDEMASLVAANEAGFSPGRLSAFCISAALQGLLVGISDATPERISAFCDALDRCWAR